MIRGLADAAILSLAALFVLGLVQLYRYADIRDPLDGNSLYEVEHKGPVKSVAAGSSDRL